VDDREALEERIDQVDHDQKKARATEILVYKVHRDGVEGLASAVPRPSR
jgi:hypothetical protein